MALFRSCSVALVLLCLPVVAAAQTNAGYPAQKTDSRTIRSAVCGVKGSPFAGGPLPFESDIQVDADDISVSEAGVSEFSGDVKMRFERRLLRAEQLSYDREREVISSTGGIQYRDSQVAVEGSSLTLDAGTRNADFESVDFSLAETGARGRAGRITVQRQGKTQLSAVDYTNLPGR